MYPHWIHWIYWNGLEFQQPFWYINLPTDVPTRNSKPKMAHLLRFGSFQHLCRSYNMLKTSKVSWSSWMFIYELLITKRAIVDCFRCWVRMWFDLCLSVCYSAHCCVWLEAKNQNEVKQSSTSALKPHQLNITQQFSSNTHKHTWSTWWWCKQWDFIRHSLSVKTPKTLTFSVLIHIKWVKFGSNGIIFHHRFSCWIFSLKATHVYASP